MRKKVEIELDEDLLLEVIRRYQVLDAREAVNLALRALLNEADSADGDRRDDEFDEFSDLSAWQPQSRRDSG